jgi:hypothetical protein
MMHTLMAETPPILSESKRKENNCNLKVAQFKKAFYFCN